MFLIILICSSTLFFVPVINCEEQVWVSKDRVKREGSKGDEMMMEMENYAIYKPVNELLLEVTKTQERCNKINQMVKMMKKNLKIEKYDVENRLHFSILWDKWVPISPVYSQGLYGHHIDNDPPKDSKYELCEISYYNTQEKIAIEEFYMHSLEKASQPLDNLNEYLNQTLKDITPQLDVMKNLITLRLKLCDTKDSEVCKENIKKWTLLEIKRYKSILERIKQNLQIPSIMRMMQRISDDIRTFKHEYFKILNEKKQTFLCCQQSIMLRSNTACGIIEEKYVFPPIQFGNVSLSQEIEETPTTQATMS